MPIDRTARNDELDALITETRAADILDISIRTLQSWRTRRTGPPFVRVGRAVRYRPSHLSLWVDANTVRFTGNCDD